MSSTAGPTPSEAPVLPSEDHELVGSDAVSGTPATAPGRKHSGRRGKGSSAPAALDTADLPADAATASSEVTAELQSVQAAAAAPASRGACSASLCHSTCVFVCRFVCVPVSHLSAGGAISDGERSSQAGPGGADSKRKSGPRKGAVCPQDL